MTSAPKPRRDLLRLGRRGEQVRVFLERGHELVRVQVTKGGAVEKTQSWPNTPANRAAAQAFAKGLDEARRDPTRGAPAAPLTLRELWDKYTTAEFPHLRDNSKRLYTEGWTKWETFAGRGFLVESTTLEMVDQFRRALERRGLKVNTIKQAINTAKLIYAWGERRELVTRNRLRLYRLKVAKDQRPESPAEYRREDFRLLLAQLDPAKGTQWRAYVALALCGYQGTRQWAVVHLQWADLAIAPDWSSGVVTWRAAWDKLGKEWTQPLRPGALAALQVADTWRAKRGDESPWVLPSAKAGRAGEVYTAQSLWTALKAAESRAGIAPQRGRGAHGLRRMVVGDIAELTGDPMLGLHAIGDSDPRMAERYRKKRHDLIAAAFQKLDARDARDAADARTDGAAAVAESAPNPQPSRNPAQNDDGRPE